MKCNKLTREPAGSGDTNLLAENSPDRQLKTVPSARCAQPGTSRHQRRKQRVLGEMCVNGFDVRANVEQAPHSGHNSR